MLHRLLQFLTFAFSILLFACSAPQTALDVRHFADAKNNFIASDFKAALENLDGTIKTTNNDALRQQALLVRVALVTALADANEQMAEAYHVGARQPAAHAQVNGFYKERSDYNNAARSYLMDAMQSVMDHRSKLSGNLMPIDVPFPGFTGADDPALAKIKGGLFVSDNERLNAELQLDRNCLARVLSALAGADQNLNKGREIYDAGKVQVDPRVYLVVLSDSFLRTGAMFDTKGLNEPDKFRIVNQVVRGNLDTATKLLQAKPDKDLETRVKKMQDDCDKCLKKLGA
ncbi:MAG: hypothetical protein WBR26_06165 [Candidatus Acidiferrum sp.]